MDAMQMERANVRTNAKADAMTTDRANVRITAPMAVMKPAAVSRLRIA